MARPRKNAAKAQGSLLAQDEVAEIPVEEQPYPLPEGWKWVWLGDLCSFVGGGTPDKSKCEYWNGNIPWASVKDIKGTYLYDTIDHITDSGVKNSATNICRPGELILVTRISPAKTIISKINTAINQDLKIVQSSIYVKFLHYYFCNFEDVFLQKARGITVKGITISRVQTTEFPLPPRDEQQRIVDRIESLFAKLDEAKEKAEAVLDGFEIRKAAILHKAFTGELTAKWREIRGIKKENNTVKIKDILSDIKYGTSEKSDYTYTGLPVIRIPNITGSSVDLEDLKFLKSSKSSDYNLVERNDILMIRSNGSRELVGKCALVDEVIVGKAYASFLIRLRPNPTINPKYLLGFLNSSLARNQLFAKAKSSAGIHNINSKEICSVDIWLPDKKEQQEIVRILDSLLEKEQQVKEAAENVLNQIDLMKKAILARAFRGELGTHDSERNSPRTSGSM